MVQEPLKIQLIIFPGVRRARSSLSYFVNLKWVIPLLSKIVVDFLLFVYICFEGNYESASRVPQVSIRCIHIIPVC